MSDVIEIQLTASEKGSKVHTLLRTPLEFAIGSDDQICVFEHPLHERRECAARAGACWSMLVRNMHHEQGVCTIAGQQKACVWFDAGTTCDWGSGWYVAYVAYDYVAKTYKCLVEVGPTRGYPCRADETGCY